MRALAGHFTVMTDTGHIVLSEFLSKTKGSGLPRSLPRQVYHHAAADPALEDAFDVSVQLVQ